MNIIILISLFIVYIEGKQLFHEGLSTDEVKHYFGTTSKDDIPAYEFISPQKLTTQQDKDGTEDRHHQYLLKAFNDDYHLKLYKNQDLISPGCLLREVGANDTEYIVPCPLEELDCVYHGHLANHSGSWAAISTCDGLNGIVSVTGHDLMIQPVRVAHRHLVQQTTGIADGNLPHLVYKKQKHGKTCAGSETEGNSTDSNSMPNTSRRRRAVGRKTIEVKVVVAPDSYRFHKDDTRRFAITVMNIAAQRFLDPSLGQKIYMSLVEVKILKAEPSDLRIVADANTLLHDFCRWQSKDQPQDDANPMFADNVVLITRTDLFYNNDYYTTGLGLSSGTCKMTEKCSVNEDRGLGTGITIAHETGHTLGMVHDGYGNNCAKNAFIMAISGGGLQWSECSKQALQRFLRSTSSSCLNDSPAGTDLSNPRKKAGEIYSKDAQCQLAMKDPESKVCEGTPDNNGNECRYLICSQRNSQRCSKFGRPRMDGTECGNRKWCINARCVAMGANSPGPIDGKWSEWESEWSDCTRTCGGGVKIKRRWCNNPEPRYGGKPCDPPQEYLSKLCNIQKCPSYSNQFKYREEQCASFDKVPQNGRTYHWTPATGYGTSCRLYCKAAGTNEVITRPHFHDGTECSSNADFGRCINGKCLPFGCDGHLNSPLRFDRCTVCNGAGNTCTPKSGRYNQGVAKQFVTFLTIPKGATGIHITNNNDQSYMSISVNNRLLFGQSKKAFSGTYDDNGVVVQYNTRPEKIKIVGPIPVAIEAKVYRYFDDRHINSRPDISYTYNVPNSQTQNNVYQWKTTAGSCSQTCGTGTIRVTVTCMKGQQVTDDYHCDVFTKPAESVTPCNTQDCPPEWFIGDWGSCTASCGRGTKLRTVSCVVIQGDDKRTVAENRCNLGRKPQHVQPCNLGECNGVWKTEAWSTCSTTCSNGVKTRTVSCYKDHNYAQKLPENSCTARKPSVIAICLTQPCDFTKSGSNCADEPDVDCSSYGTDVCHGQFESWSKENCALFCGFCVKDPSQYQARCDDTPECRGRDTSVCTEYKEWAETNCKRLCNLCPSGYQVTHIAAPTCRDNVDCNNYQKDICTQYIAWSRSNCPKHCGFCISPTTTTHVIRRSTVSSCNDLVNCNNYQKDVCSTYKDWAKTNCPRQCGFCTGPTTTNVHTQSHTTVGVCKDTVDCNNYQKDVCSTYKDWAKSHCSRHCGFCTGPTTASHTHLHTTIGVCKDTVDCNNYQKDICSSYKPWALSHCAKHCGFCTTPIISTHAVHHTTPKPCKDIVKCNEYQKDVCSTYKAWATTHCPKHCGFCTGTATRYTTTPVPSNNVCEDSVNCNSYQKDVCTTYRAWSIKNCQKHCGFCLSPTSTSTTTTTTTSRLTTPARVCVDTVNCSNYQSDVCTRYKAWSMTHCGKHCGFCIACEDKSSDCAKYPADTCQSYPEWAKENCKKHCNLCTTSAATTRAPSQTSTCVDKHENCASYGKNACQDYAEWAKDNCQKYCNLCPAQTAGTASACTDKHQDCASYGKSACNDYPEWASENCQSFCNLCQTQSCVDKNNDCPQYGRDTCQNYPEWAKENCQNYCNLCGTRRKRSAISEPANHYLAPPPLPKTRHLDSNVPEPPKQEPQLVPTHMPIDKAPPPLNPETILNGANGDIPSPKNPEEDQKLQHGLPPEEGGQVVYEVPRPQTAVKTNDDDADFKIPPPPRKLPVSENEMFEESDNLSDNMNDNQNEDEKRQLIEQLDDLRERD